MATEMLIHHWAGYCAVLFFTVAYILVIAEEVLHLRKSKPVIVAAGVIWCCVAVAYHSVGKAEEAAHLIRHNLLEFAELMLFLLSAMTYINTLQERNVFEALRGKLVSLGLSLRAIYWVTGVMSFFLSPIADNLTTALVMGAVVLSVGSGQSIFVAIACINIVVAANAGGAFSPFGDITTLMVWQKGVVRIDEFLALFIPSLVSWIIPAVLMAFAVPQGRPDVAMRAAHPKKGAAVVTILFLLTVMMTVVLHHVLHLPPFLGMMTGLGFLKLYGHIIRKRELGDWQSAPKVENYKPANKPFDIFVSVKRVEWDTLMFFYGVMLCVGGLGAFGYLTIISQFFYQDMGPTLANTIIGLLSAIVDNIPVMFAILNMNPDMGHAQWLLVTLTAGIGGSLLSIGSAAGVALMGQAKGQYTFMSHLKWLWAIALGYFAGVAVHLFINGT